MPRRFNYTGRKKINRADAEIRLHGVGTELRFDAKLTLGGYHLDPQARVAVEAYRARTANYRRFEFGHLNAPLPPADRSLGDFLDPKGILFRVKVTLDTDGLGRLIAEADGIRPYQPDETAGTVQPLLDVVSYDLGGEAWRLNFRGASAPELVIDSSIPEKQDYARDPRFRALAAPSILREILTRILLIDQSVQEDDPEHWTNRWVKFGERQVGQPVPEFENDDKEDECRDWIDDAVRSFAKQGKLVDALSIREV